jgi:hypothetical protein
MSRDSSVNRELWVVPPASCSSRADRSASETHLTYSSCVCVENVWSFASIHMFIHGVVLRHWGSKSAWIITDIKFVVWQFCHGMPHDRRQRWLLARNRINKVNICPLWGNTWVYPVSTPPPPPMTACVLSYYDVTGASCWVLRQDIYRL